MRVVTVRVFCVLTGSLTATLYVREMAQPFNVGMRATGEYATSIATRPSRLALEGRYAFHMVFQERWSFLPRAHSILHRSALWRGQDFVTSGRKLHLSWKTMRNSFSPMLRCVAKILPIIIRRCIYWCQSGEMEISPTCSYHWQHSVAWKNRSAHLGRTEVIHLLSSIRQQAQAVTHPSTNPYQCFLTCRIWLRTVCAPCQVTTDLATLLENTS